MGEIYKNVLQLFFNVIPNQYPAPVCKDEGIALK